MNDIEMRGFNVLTDFGLVPVPDDTGTGTLYKCHTLDNPEPASAALVSYSRLTGRWGVLAPWPLQGRLLTVLGAL